MPTSTSHLGIFYMPHSYDMGPTALRPLQRKARWRFFRPKNPTASAGCKPANLGTKGQHATSRPPKPLSMLHAAKQSNSQCIIPKLVFLNTALWLRNFTEVAKGNKLIFMSHSLSLISWATTSVSRRTLLQEWVTQVKPKQGHLEPCWGNRAPLIWGPSGTSVGLQGSFDWYGAQRAG